MAILKKKIKKRPNTTAWFFQWTNTKRINAQSNWMPPPPKQWYKSIRFSRLAFAWNNWSHHWGLSTRKVYGIIQYWSRLHLFTIPPIYRCVSKSIHVHACTGTNTCMCAGMGIHTHMHTHTHTMYAKHTHTHARCARMQVQVYAHRLKTQFLFFFWSWLMMYYT